MRILYLIGKIISFPGAFLHGLWEHIICRMIRLPVEQAGYLNPDESCGHIEHEWTESRKQQLLLCLVPGLFNFALGLPLFFAGYSQLLYFGRTAEDNLWLFLLLYGMLYLGASLLCNLAPLTEDAMHSWALLYHPAAQVTKKGLWRFTQVALLLPMLCMRIHAFFERYSLSVLCMLGLIAASFLWL